MDLNAYIKKNPGSPRLLAEKLGVSEGFISHLATGRRKPPIKKCAAIEVETGGQVTRKDLRPNDWHEIWPELA